MRRNAWLRLGWLVVGIVLFACAHPAQAVIVGPYTPNANTVHLLHLNEAQGTTSLPDAVSGAGTWNANPNGQNGLGQAGYTGSSGFETSLQIGEPRGFRLTQPGAQILGSTNGSWTIETLMNFNNTNAGETIRGGTGGTELRLYLLGNSSFQVQIPNGNTTGFTANLGFNIQNNTWYHVGLVYDSTITSANNTFLYMTEMNPATTEAVLRSSLNIQPGVGFTSYSDTMNYIDLGIQSAGNANVLLDEFRISNVALGAGQMMFAPEPSTFALGGGLAACGLVAAGIRRRRR